MDDFELIAQPDNGYARFLFTGRFEGKEVVWDAHLYTLAYYVNQVAEFSQSAPAIRQFIEVGDTNKNGRRIEIGLNLKSIDNGAIMKTIIMIRQYKRLAVGRHEYGETVRTED